MRLSKKVDAHINKNLFKFDSKTRLKNVYILKGNLMVWWAIYFVMNFFCIEQLRGNTCGRPDVPTDEVVEEEGHEHH